MSTPRSKEAVRAFRSALGRRLSSLIEARGQTESSFARVVGKAQSTINTWCAGDAEPKASDLPRLADALGVSVAVLLGQVDLEIEESVPLEVRAEVTKLARQIVRLVNPRQRVAQSRG